MATDETSRYDRQIRLWGKSAQLRLKETSVVFKALSGVSSEVAKNLVLGGVNSVCIQDLLSSNLWDYQTNYLLQGADAKESAVESAAAVLRRLNPFVHVSVSATEVVFEGNIKVVVQEVSTLSSIRQTLAHFGEGIDAYIFITSAKGSVVAFCLHHQEKMSFEAQLAELLDSNTLLHLPPLVQMAVLSLVVHDAQTVGDSYLSQLLMVESFAAHVGTTEKHLSFSYFSDAYELEKTTNSISSTICGAQIAHQLVQLITGAHDSWTWLLHDTQTSAVSIG